MFGIRTVPAVDCVTTAERTSSSGRGPTTRKWWAPRGRSLCTPRPMASRGKCRPPSGGQMCCRRSAAKGPMSAQFGRNMCGPCPRWRRSRRSLPHRQMVSRRTLWIPSRSGRAHVRPKFRRTIALDFCSAMCDLVLDLLVVKPPRSVPLRTLSTCTTHAEQMLPRAAAHVANKIL